MKKKYYSDLSLCEYIDHLVYDFVIDDPEDSVISEGLCTMDFILMNIADECDFKDLSKRIKKVISSRKSNLNHFDSNKHKKLFISRIQEENHFYNSFMAGIYLLTSNENLWASVREHVEVTDVNFEAVSRLPKNGNYVLLKVAQDLISGTKHLTIRDLVNPSIVDRKTFLLVCKAMAICMYGLEAVGLEVYRVDEKGVMIGDNF